MDRCVEDPILLVAWLDCLHERSKVEWTTVVDSSLVR